MIVSHCKLYQGYPGWFILVRVKKVIRFTIDFGTPTSFLYCESEVCEDEIKTGGECRMSVVKNVALF